jgi:sugar lactone lactonase YvrE
MAIGFSPDAEQRFMYVADGANHKVWILRRDTLEIVGSFGKSGRGGGQMLVLHALAVDSKGDVYVGETIPGNRIQRFRFTGMGPAATH